MNAFIFETLFKKKFLTRGVVLTLSQFKTKTLFGNILILAKAKIYLHRKKAFKISAYLHHRFFYEH